VVKLAELLPSQCNYNNSSELILDLRRRVRWDGYKTETTMGELVCVTGGDIY